MYYLSCVDAVISYNKSDMLSDYQHYYLLNPAQKDILVKTCELLNPKIFINAGIFIVDDKLLLNGSNQFYQITDQRIGIHINREIMIGGRVVKVLKVMACNINWLNSYYITPLKNIHSVKNLAYCLAKVLTTSPNNFSNSMRTEDEDEECIIW